MQTEHLMAYAQNPQHERQCETCGTIFLVKPGERRTNPLRRRRFCSRRCSKLGTLNQKWKGSDATDPNVGRKRARHRYVLTDCAQCGRAGKDRHHKDGNTFNNDPSNVVILCRTCHMNEDGRLSSFTELGKKNRVRGAVTSAKLRKARTHCRSGHEYTAENTRLSPNGSRVCKTCSSEASARYWKKLRMRIA